MKGRTGQCCRELRLVGRTSPLKSGQVVNAKRLISSINPSSCPRFPPPFPSFASVPFPICVHLRASAVKKFASPRATRANPSFCVKSPCGFCVGSRFLRFSRSKLFPPAKIHIHPCSSVVKNPFPSPKQSAAKNKKLPNEPILSRRSLGKGGFTLLILHSAFRVPSLSHSFTNPIDRINHAVRTGHRCRPIKFS